MEDFMFSWIKKSLFLVLSLAAISAGAEDASDWYSESLYDSWKQSFRISKIIYQEKSDLFDLLVFENPIFGRVLAMDGAIQITENDEYVYQEMITHVPLIAHGNAENVLIIGGGDGGALREVERHKEVKKIVLVEIDPTVIDLSKKYFPMICKNAFSDPRVEIVIQDGTEYVKAMKNRFDVIICDSTDPIGPGKVLFTPEFYANCKKALRKGGIFVNHTGVPFLQKETLPMVSKGLKRSFSKVNFYVAAIPTYVGGFMAFGFASDNVYTNLKLELIQKRLQEVTGTMKYYNADIHKASFALPNFIEDMQK